MKILLTVAATLAAFTSVSIAAASQPSGGHYEWQNRPQPGPNKTNLPSRVRVWVKDAIDMASDDCAMMRNKSTSADCMAMPGNGERRSKG